MVERGARPLGITRHQFLLDERIKYTTHNSGACVAVEWGGALRELDFAIELLAGWAAEGSDPGICICARDAVPREIMDWGWSATREVLTQQRAIALAAKHGILLKALGGSGDGIIGAWAGVGLRAEGNEGRFLDMPGLRQLGEYAETGELADMGIEVEHRTPVGPGGARYKTLDWVRPRLVKGRAVWPVKWSKDEHAWVPVDRKRSRPLE
jgi:hypothetical protein